MSEKVWPVDPTGEQLPRGLAEVNTGRVESLSGYDWDNLLDDYFEDTLYIDYEAEGEFYDD